MCIRDSDSAGVQRTSGGERFRVTMRGASAPHVDLIDVGDGTYDASYVAVLSGCYQLIVTLDGVHVPGSPFTVHVRASSAAAPRCVATGSGLREARAGERATFCIQAVDADGSQKTCGGDVFFGALVGPLGDGDDGEDDDDGAPIAVSDRRNGRHTGSYAVRATRLHIQREGRAAHRLTSQQNDACVRRRRPRPQRRGEPAVARRVYVHLGRALPGR